MIRIDNNLKKYMDNDIETKLIKEYNEALESEQFKEFINNINLPIETMSRYTSILEECSEEYSNCKNCKGLAMCKNKINGYAYLPKVNDKQLQFNYKACKYREKQKEAKKYMNNIITFDEPKEIVEAKMKNVYLDSEERFKTIEYLNKFFEGYKKSQSGKGLYLHGNFGCGKTYLISAIFNELAKDGYRSAIVFWPEFLRNLKSSFGSDFKEKFEKVKRSPLLLIDDIGAESTTSWGRDEILCPIIQYRMQENLPTFFTSNLDLKALEEHFSVSKSGVEEIKSRRIIERIKQLTQSQEMIGKNLRK